MTQTIAVNEIPAEEAVAELEISQCQIAYLH